MNRLSKTLSCYDYSATDSTSGSGSLRWLLQLLENVSRYRFDV